MVEEPERGQPEDTGFRIAGHLIDTPFRIAVVAVCAIGGCLVLVGGLLLSEKYLGPLQIAAVVCGLGFAKLCELVDARAKRPLGFAILRVCAFALMAIGMIGHLGGGFYLLLRWVVFGLSVYGVRLTFEERGYWWTLAFTLCGGIFNPFYRLQLGRDTWLLIDALTVTLLLVSIKYVPRPQRPQLIFPDLPDLFTKQVGDDEVPPRT